jgi:acyl dehydratase
MTPDRGGSPAGAGSSLVRPRLKVADLPANVGKELGISRWIVVTMEEIAAFAEATGDRQWIHVDVERASTGPFGGPVAHGFLVLTAVARLFPQILEITDRSMSVNYGTERVRFMSPVLAGSSVRLRGVLSGVEERPDDAKLLRISAKLDLAGSEEPAATAELLFLVSPGPS